MPSITQQDWLVVPIVDVTDPTDAEIATLKKHILNGTIFDILIEDSTNVASVTSGTIKKPIDYIEEGSAEWVIGIRVGSSISTISIEK